MRNIWVLLLGASAWAQTASLVVTAEGHHRKDAPLIEKTDVQVHSGKEQVSIGSWEPERGPLQLLVMIDDGLDSDLGLQLEDLRKFIRAQPANVEIGVDYMRNGTTIAAHALTVDHDAAAKSLRLPIGQAGAAASPYVALSERIKKWAPFVGRREVLMISSGTDSLYYGGDLQNPYLLKAIADSQKSGILVHSIYYESAGHYGHSYYQVNLGQSYLSRLGDETGGEAYWQGLQSPVAFAPYLDDLTKRLGNQYRLTFAGKVDQKAEFQPVRVRTDKSDAELSSASRVWVGRRN
jgi:hypothetical protein